MSDTELVQNQDCIALQARELYAIREVSRWFHFPQPNNYVFLLVKKSDDLDTFSDNWMRLTFHLNEADKELLRFCCNHLEKNPDYCAALLARKWLECMNNRVNLQGVHWSGLLIDRIESNGSIESSFCDYLQTTAPDVVNLFQSVPEELSDITRLNIYLRQSEVNNVLKKILHLISKTSMLEFIERVEVAKHDDRPKACSIQYDESFPKLILYVDRKCIDREDSFRNCLQAIKTILAAVNMPLTARPDYAYSWIRNCNITEGFMLFKKYLHRVGVLDLVYAKSTNYGLRIGSRLRSLI